MTSTHTSDCHLSISVKANSLDWDYKGTNYSAALENGVDDPLELIFEELNNQYEKVDKLRGALWQAVENIKSCKGYAKTIQTTHAFEELIKSYNQILRETING